MKQIFQDLAKGGTEVVSVPRPACKAGHLVIRSSRSLISAGTERMVAEFSRAGYLQKARQKPDKVKMVLDKVRTEGLMATVEAVRAKLDEPVAMGYSNVGTVLEIGAGVTEFRVGDRVVSNGSHAEIVCVSKNLCARVPDGIADEEAVFTVVGAIALQGTRLANPTLGECFVVTGLGLIGLLTVQILRAQGCRVLGIDKDDTKLELARSFGADVVNLAEREDPIEAAQSFSRGRGVDGVIITASTKSNEPIHQAATMCRQRGRIVLVGVVGMALDRADFYRKEISFQVSCSYGPGRYDPAYEDNAQDYPLGFVRWTEQRNFEAILDMLDTRAIQTENLRSAELPIESAADAYDLLISDSAILGVLISYAAEEIDIRKTLSLQDESIRPSADSVIVAAIGAGNYAGRILLPAFKKAGAEFRTIASSQGVSGNHVGRKLKFQVNTTDLNVVFDDPDVNAVVIATQHDSHAALVVRALDAGKHVFVEKPLALTAAELDSIDVAYTSAVDRGDTPILMVGFNRRFSPLVKKVKAQLQKSSAPISLIYTCNAREIDKDSWIQDPARGGGRIVGEACHFIDIARFLAGSPIVSVSSVGMMQPSGAQDCRDTASITLSFENGSIATIHYFANGHSAFPKERIEVFQAKKIMLIDNFRKLRCHGGALNDSSLARQDKGQLVCTKAFVDAVKSGGEAPIPYPELIEVSRASIDAARQLKE